MLHSYSANERQLVCHYANRQRQEAQVFGAGNGYVAVFDQSGNLQATLISQGALKRALGMAIAPSTYGPFGGALLVGNFRRRDNHAFNYHG